MSKLKAILGFIETRSRLTGLGIFVFALTLYGLTQAHPSFKDPDSFFHARMALLTVQSGPVAEFPWLPFTTLADAFADHHFAYHVALIPFVGLFGPIVGLKVAAALFGAAAVSAFYFAARSLRIGIPFAAPAALILATSANFMFRMNLAKAASLSVVLLMFGVAAAARRKPIALLALGFVYVWTHGSWPLLIFVAAAFALAARGAENRLAILFAPAVGAFAGLVVNPFFPKNLEFYWHQIVHAALINYGATINVGNEWRPVAPLELVGQNGAVFVLLAICAAVWLVARFWSEPAARGASPELLNGQAALRSLAIVFAALLVMTLRSIRHVDYLLPCGMLLAAAAGDHLSRRFDLRAVWRLAFADARRLGIAVSAYLCLSLLILGARDSVLTLRSFHDGDANIPGGAYERVGAWMTAHLPADAVVFHANWADFPPLFFRAPQFRYIAGLDPTFFYLKDPAKFFEWRAVAEGQVSDVSAAVEAFGAKYLLVTPKQKAFADAVAADRDLRLVYQDEEAMIYFVFP